MGENWDSSLTWWASWWQKSGKADPKMQKNAKKTVEDRDKKFGQEFDSLFDVASCQDKNPESCNCPAGLKVPPNWVAFLQDQRSSRLHTNTLLSDRAQSLRGGIRDLTFEEKNEHQRALEKFEEKIQREKRMVERKRKPLLPATHKELSRWSGWWQKLLQQGLAMKGGRVLLFRSWSHEN